jgi:PKD repeat protein
MMKHYITLSRKGWNAALMGLLGLFSLPAHAQLSGSYTIDGTTATGGTNFQTWAAFSSKISSSGVSGPVTVTVKTDETSSGTSSTTAVMFNAISGASSTNTITIDGNNKVLSKSTSTSYPQVILFNGADYVTIKNLTIRNTTNSSYNKGIRFANGSDYNTINGCTIEFSALTSGSTSGAGAYIMFSTSTSGMSSSSTVYNGSYNTISNNLMRTTNSNSPGPAYAIAFYGASGKYSNTGANNTIKGNTIQNFYYYGFWQYYSNGNQWDGNDLSRDNATSRNCYSYLYPFYSYYSYSTNRGTQFTNNDVHDLPYDGATTSSGVYYFYGSYFYNNNGTSANHFKFENNSFKDIAVYYTAYVSYSYYSYWADIDGNTIDNLDNYSGSASYFYGIYSYYGSNHSISGNTYRNCNTSYYTYLIRDYNPSGSSQKYDNNVFEDNTFGYYAYMINPYYTNGTSSVSGNRMINNKISGGYYGYGYLYMIYNYYPYGSTKMNNNLMVDNMGYYGCYPFYCYSYTTSTANVEYLQNTLRHSKNPGYSSYTEYCFYNYTYYSKVKFAGNIVESNAAYGYMIYSYNQSATNYTLVDYNSWYAPMTQVRDWAMYPQGTTGATSSAFQDWTNLDRVGDNEKHLKSTFKDEQNYDFTEISFENQNNVATQASNKADINGRTRNPYFSDRGAVESTLDLVATGSGLSLPDTVCTGYDFKPTLDILNTYVDTAYGFNVSVSMNDGKPMNYLVSDLILPKDTLTFTAADPIYLNGISGPLSIKIFVNVPDDNTSNDTLEFTTFVLPAPGGGVYSYSSKATEAVYQKSRPFDVTVINQPVIYDVNAPRVYSNSGYGTDWTASTYAEKADGSSVSGASLVAPSGSTDMEVTFLTSDASLEDETITVITKVTDLNNGCDTFIKRNILIYPSIDVDFKFPAKICDGEAVLFENMSEVKSGGMEFFWNFGTGNAADTSNAPEPVFQFAGAGTYNVVLTAKTLPYGFVFYDTQSVEVNAIPTVAFDKKNACEGENLTFTNKTTPATATSKWAFGDGGTSTSANPTHKYAKAGTYNVTLTADLNGCVASLTQRVYQFDKPTAKWNLISGTCDNEGFVFENNSNINSGLAGSYWDFDDNGAVSTEFDAEHQFSAAGKKQVKLVTTSEFGCKDSMIMEVEVRESPKASFVSTAACSLTPTTFTNTTPDVAGTVANYAWDFGDGTTSTAKSPSKNWTALGPKTVTMTVTLDNGCSQTITKDMNVLTQPKASFEAGDVCAGDPVIFVNNTTWPQGEISYNWDFGDNTSSTNSDPSKAYNVIQTTSYNVTLYAYIKGGCADSITQRVTVNEAPRTCDFTVSPDYSFGFYGIVAEPVDGSGVTGGQDNVDYTWIFEGGGSKQTQDKNAAVNHEFQNDGTFKVTMRAKVRQTGCECTQTKTIVMDRAAAEGLAKSGVGVYPNPSEGQFNVAMTENIGSQVNLVVTTLSGQVVYSATEANTGLTSVNISDLASGVYMLTVTSENARVTQKITKQ